MNGTIINPAVFYWMSVLDSTRSVCMALLVIAGIICFLLSIFHFVVSVEDDYDGDEFKNKVKKGILILAICCAVFALVLIFIPTKETMVEMLVAKTVTYENAQWTVDTVKEVVDYIIQAIKTLQ